ncbi:MAG: cryptochrome/photolyase family protein, partial [Pseudomonadota bacterium]
MPNSTTAKAGDSPRVVHILGDQLSPDMSSLKAADRARDVVFMCEVHDETTYVRHHKKKIALILSAMRHFADELRSDGWTVDYVKLDADGNSGSFSGEVQRAVKRHSACGVIVTEPGEYRVRADMEGWGEALGVDVQIIDDDRFVYSRAEFAEWADGRKALRMENFYREVRKTTGLLMDGDKPLGEKWNFDHDNRKPAKADLFMPQRLWFEPDAITQDVLDLVGARFDNHFGDLKPFRLAVTRADAEKVFQ